MQDQQIKSYSTWSMARALAALRERVGGRPISPEAKTAFVESESATARPWNSSMLTRSSCLAAGLAATALLLAACDEPPVPRPTTQAWAVVLDVSNSGVFAPASRCEELEQRLTQTTRRPDFRHKLVVKVFASGNAANGGEPATLIEWTEIAPKPRSLLPNPPPDPDAVVEAIVTTCRANLTPTKDSPIFRAVEVATHALEAKASELERNGRIVGADSAVYLHSDLRETVDSTIMRRLAWAERGSTQKAPEEPAKLSSRFPVMACGLSQLGRATSQRAVQAVWDGILAGTGPASSFAGRFAPDCPRKGTTATVPTATVAAIDPSRP